MFAQKLLVAPVEGKLHSKYSSLLKGMITLLKSDVVEEPVPRDTVEAAASEDKGRSGDNVLLRNPGQDKEKDQDKDQPLGRLVLKNVLVDQDKDQPLGRLVLKNVLVDHDVSPELNVPSPSSTHYYLRRACNHVLVMEHVVDRYTPTEVYASCVMCGGAAARSADASLGRLLPLNLKCGYVHANCARWASGVVEQPGGRLEGFAQSLARRDNSLPHCLCCMYNA